MRHALCLVFVSASACGTGTAPDTGSGGDTGIIDTAPPTPTIGEITGDCGVLDADTFQDPSPQFFRNAIDFGEAFDESLLGEGAAEVLADGNLGGSSLYSEAIAFEVLDLCESAELLKTEAEISYQDSGGKKTDLLVSIGKDPIGVSVTRAYHYPPEDGMTVQDATELLEGKLDDILLSADNAAKTDAWTRSVLHIIAWDSGHADAVESAYAALDSATQDATLVVMTVTDGDDDLLY
jgi:hypothetical protein